MYLGNPRMRRPSRRKSRGVGCPTCLGGDGFGATEISKPEDINVSAQQFAAGFSSDPFKQKAYAYMYKQARSLTERALSDPKVKDVASKITAAGNMAFEAGHGVADLVSSIGTKGRVDASGVADITQLAGSFTKSIISFAQSIGLDSQTAQDVSDWTGIAVGCVAGIATAAAAGFGFGGLAAAVGCAFSVLIKLFSAAGWTHTPEIPPDQPRMILRALAGQASVLQSDAARLAAVLHYHYGLNSFQPLLDRLNLMPWVTNYPAATYPFDPAAIKQAVPAVSGTALLVAMHDWRIGADEFDGNLPRTYNNLRGVLNAIAWVTSGKQSGEDFANLYTQLPLELRGYQIIPGMDGPIGEQLHPCDLSWRFVNEEDVNVTAISHGAALCRGVLARSGATSNGGVGSTVLECPFDLDGSWLATGPAKKYPEKGTWYFDLAPFLRVEELINYFVAVTISERENLTPGSPKPWDVYTGFLPIGNINALKKVGGKDQPYDEKCWTGLYRGGDYQCDNPSGGNDLRTLVGSGNLNDGLTYAALKEFAYIRLLSAFAQLLNWWNWSARVPTGRVDPIRSVAEEHARNPIDSTIAELRHPVNPRQAVEVSGEPGNWTFNNYHELREDKGSTEYSFAAPIKPFEDCSRDSFAYSVQQNYCTWPMLGVPTGLWHLKVEAIRDGRRLAGVIRQRESTLGGLIKAAQEQAAADAKTAYNKWIVEHMTFNVLDPKQYTAYTYEDVRKAKIVKGLLLGVGTFLAVKYFLKKKGQ